MRIKKIEIHGFKSFKDRTVIQFDRGITGVVGPNGCGKSNIVDALLWVMGEMSAKDLRGSSMMDVIFAGSENYPPSGMAEVSLVLENDGGPFPIKYAGHSEIMLTRKLHRNGESEYLINKEEARLRDIQEIFMDTGAGAKGFSIIQQGMIGRIISAKPEDRKMLIEEASGIVKFKVRKRESERKLDSTEQNLLRLKDILIELKRQVDSLSRQAEKAQKYRELKKKIEGLDLWNSSQDWKQWNDQEVQITDELLVLEDQLTQLGVEASQLEAKLSEEKLKGTLLEKKSQEIGMALEELSYRLQQTERNLHEVLMIIEQAKSKESVAQSIVKMYQARRSALQMEEQGLKAKFQEAKEKERISRSQFEENQRRLQKLEDENQSVEEQLSNLRKENLAAGHVQLQLRTKMASLQGQLLQKEDEVRREQALQDEIAARKIEFSKYEEQVKVQVQAEVALQSEVQNALAEAEQKRVELVREVSSRQQEYETLRQEYSELSSRLQSLEELAQNFEGFSEGVKKLMEWQKSRADEVTPESELRLLSQCFEVPQRFELALEAGLGDRLQALVSSDRQSIKRAVATLKEQRWGRASFSLGPSGERGEHILRVEPSAKEALKQTSGVVCLLEDVVELKAHPELKSLVTQVVVVEEIQKAIELQPEFPGFHWVSLEGDTLTAGGFLSAGMQENASSGVLKRQRQIKELTALRGQVAGKCALAKENLDRLIVDQQRAEVWVRELQQKKFQQDLKLAEVRKDFERAQTELVNVTEAMAKQERNVICLQKQLADLQSQSDELCFKEQELQEKISGLTEQISELEIEMETQSAKLEESRSSVMKLQYEVENDSREVKRCQEQLATVQKEISEIEIELLKSDQESRQTDETLNISESRKAELEVEIRRGLDQREELRLQSAEVKAEFERVQAQVRELEALFHQSQRKDHEYKQKKSEILLRLEQVRLKKASLMEQIREKYMVELSEVYERYLTGELIDEELKENIKDAEQVARVLKSLKEQVSCMGEVNLSATQEYEQVKTRYDFLMDQQRDLLAAKDQLQEVIGKINDICAIKFTETFELVNERFMKVFPALFGGGEARLSLVEIPEKGEIGIDIVAQPPGKKMQNISLLSGGEKALTAVCLIFAIFLVKPSPYCLLDEVDSPLDDTNVLRFNELVKEMSKRSQIILITHNKYTMEIAGCLYGVTMQEKGVSKMVSVNLAEVS